MILFRKKFPFSLYATGIYVARNFGGCPACASSADVSVKKCHGTLQGRGRLRVTDSKRLLLYGETVLLGLREIIGFISILVRAIKVFCFEKC